MHEFEKIFLGNTPTEQRSFITYLILKNNEKIEKDAKMTKTGGENG